ncbi:MAG: SDR family oxidoreductase [Alphaproteobacteria bacterium]|nr:SDR family oxidoreductase [Alphaproteobacteria bacterium]
MADERRVALVTGGPGGLGRAMIGKLVERGTRVAIADVRGPAAEAFADEIRRARNDADVLPLTLDVGDLAACGEAVERVRGHWGALNILINNAGRGMEMIRRDYHVTAIDSGAELTPEMLLGFYRVNALGPFALMRAALPGMRAAGWGRIINVTTSLDTMLRPGYVAYGSTKAALESTSAILAKELAGTGITVNVVVPGGPTNTGFVPMDAGYDRAAMLQPDVMQGPIDWLVTRAADHVTGMRFIGHFWDRSLPPEEAARRAGDPIGWPDAGRKGVWPTKP